MKSTFDAGRLDIRNYAKYAFDSKRLNRGGFGDWFLAMLDRSALGASDQTDWKTLQLYGSFESQQQKALEQGGKFSYSALTPEQKQIVDRIVYAKRLYGSTDPQHVAFNAVEPTQAFAMGVPGSCVVSGKASGKPVIVAYSKGSDGKTHPTRDLDPYNLASIETDVVGDAAKMAAYGVPDLVGYAMGANKIVTLRVEVAPGVWSESSITIPDFDPDATPVAWEKLPAPYPAQILDAIAQVKAQKAGQPKQKIPPF